VRRSGVREPGKRFSLTRALHALTFCLRGGETDPE
jgi:hypothetical protein